MSSTLLQKWLKYVIVISHMSKSENLIKMNLLLENKHIGTPHRQQATLVHTVSKISVKAKG